MFSTMGATLIAAGVIAALIFIAAFAAEGRGERLIRILLGAEVRRPVREHLFDELERPEATLDVVGGLSRTDTAERETIRVA